MIVPSFVASFVIFPMHLGRLSLGATLYATAFGALMIGGFLGAIIYDREVLQ